MVSQRRKLVRVVSGDNKSFLVTEDALRASTVAATYIDSYGLTYTDPQNPPEFPFPGAEGSDLRTVLQFCKNQTGMSTECLSSSIDRPSHVVLPCSAWPLKLALIPTPQLLRLLRTADYCSVTALYDLCCEAVAHRMRNQTPGQLKTMLGKNRLARTCCERCLQGCKDV